MKRTISLTIDAETILRLEEYICSIDNRFNRSEFVENCFNSLIENGNADFKSINELMKEKEKIINERERISKEIAVIDLKIQKIKDGTKKENDEKLINKEKMFESLKNSGALDDDF